VFVVQGILRVPIAGSLALFLVAAALHLFATTSMAIFMATLARSMPQFGMLAVLILLPLQFLSGNSTPRESMPELVQNLMLAAPTTHFVASSQAILFRGAGLSVVWPQFHPSIDRKRPPRPRASNRIAQRIDVPHQQIRAPLQHIDGEEIRSPRHPQPTIARHLFPARLGIP
jgi:hypothetical protein